MSNQLRELSNRYAEDATELLAWIATKQVQYGDASFPNATDGIKAAIGAFNEYLRSDKSESQAKLVALEGLLQRIQTQTLNYGMKPFEPSAGQDISSIRGAWRNLGSIEDVYKSSASAKYDQFLIYDYNVSICNRKIARVNGWVDSNSAVFSSLPSGFCGSVDECDAKLDAFSVFSKNFESVSASVSEVKATAAEVGQEHQDFPSLAGSLDGVLQKMASLTSAGDSYRAAVTEAKEEAQRLNNLFKV